MAIEGTYKVEYVKTEKHTYAVDAAAEERIWALIDAGEIDDDGVSRDEYEGMDDKDKAAFLIGRAYDGDCEDEFEEDYWEGGPELHGSYRE
jgi:hypothetical protein